MNKKRERTTTMFELGGGGVFLIIFWGVRLNGVAFFRSNYCGFEFLNEVNG